MRKRKTKYTALLVCLLLAVAIAVSGTIAYIFTSSDPVINTFTPVIPEIEIPEEMNGTVKQNATVQNTGDVDSYLRAKIVVTWQNDNGEVYPEVPELGEGKDYTMTNGANWQLHKDGYYYYKKVAAPGQPAVMKNGDVVDNPEDMLIIRAEVIGKAPAEGYTLHIEILGQAIQSEPIEAVKETWGVNITSEGYVETESTTQGGQ